MPHHSLACHVLVPDRQCGEAPSTIICLIDIGILAQQYSPTIMVFCVLPDCQCVYILLYFILFYIVYYIVLYFIGYLTGGIKTVH